MPTDPLNERYDPQHAGEPAVVGDYLLTSSGPQCAPERLVGEQPPHLGDHLVPIPVPEAVDTLLELPLKARDVVADDRRPRGHGNELADRIA